MKRRTIAFLAVLLVVFAWPPIFFRYFSDYFRPQALGRGQMQDFELQELLNARRWVFDIPPEKDGWMLGLGGKSGDTTIPSGGSSVRGGTRIVLLVRQNRHDQTIEYAWYETKNIRQTHDVGPFTLAFDTNASGRGSIDDPLAAAGVLAVRPDGPIAVGDVVYRGGRESVQGLPSDEPAEFEVRVQLEPPPPRT